MIESRKEHGKSVVQMCKMRDRIPASAEATTLLKKRKSKDTLRCSAGAKKLV
jgi:hypothetical protein